MYHHLLLRGAILRSFMLLSRHFSSLHAFTGLSLGI
ncbi:hypothetical protein YPC_3362 [Yersinia pestis biovar Medievalis str. Harbin 35]|nr:hypothetical protein YPC_3362 [Yersinia pestis biovar Medievalis str. Harbin 35]EEO77422.1 hypothetical protein YP516_1088 [Yersinia pestis Nepal516]EEO79725.1 hypothetical protein YPF_3718 [Yersinia pestis biovar Orientalis str. India 195]EEO85096.1 hypothetical protein YPH_0936 [Yersinia pestis biovar Orientalis str. PEXU2]EEO89112.1 hypothetical protein YPS_3973 [Yersinia pestis Pestoides A]